MSRWMSLAIYEKENGHAYGYREWKSIRLCPFGVFGFMGSWQRSIEAFTGPQYLTRVNGRCSSGMLDTHTDKASIEV